MGGGYGSQSSSEDPGTGLLTPGRMSDWGCRPCLRERASRFTAFLFPRFYFIFLHFFVVVVFFSGQPKARGNRCAACGEPVATVSVSVAFFSKHLKKKKKILIFFLLLPSTLKKKRKAEGVEWQTPDGLFGVFIPGLCNALICRCPESPL